MARKRDRTCPYCGYTFETTKDLERHVPCPEPVTDAHGKRWR